MQYISHIKQIKIFVKRYGGALIIGAAIVIGLNFSWFTERVEFLYDVISGESTRREESARIVSEWELKRQTEALENKRLWQTFLIENNNGRQFKIIKSNHGDYACYNPENSERTSEKARPKTINEINDETLEKYIEFLNKNRFLGKDGWRYDDIDSDHYSHIFLRSTSPFRYCETPGDIYRRNRFKQRIDIDTNK